MDGLHTVIELATPAPVRFKAGNLLLFEGLEYKMLGPVPQDDVDMEVESQAADDILYGTAPLNLLESQAKLLLVQTDSFRSIGWEDHLDVYRLEKIVMENGEPSFLQILPYDTAIMGYSSEKKQTLEQSVEKHAALVKRVMNDFAANNPKVLYNGPFMQDALKSGEKEVNERIDRKAREDSAAYWAKRQ